MSHTDHKAFCLMPNKGPSTTTSRALVVMLGLFLGLRAHAQCTASLPSPQPTIPTSEPPSTVWVAARYTISGQYYFATSSAKIYSWTYGASSVTFVVGGGAPDTDGIGSSVGFTRIDGFDASEFTRIYLIDAGSIRVLLGNQVSTFVPRGFLSRPIALDIGPANNPTFLLVADADLHCVVKYEFTTAANSTFYGTCGNTTALDPTAIRIGAQGEVHIFDANNKDDIVITSVGGTNIHPLQENLTFFALAPSGPIASIDGYSCSVLQLSVGTYHAQNSEAICGTVQATATRLILPSRSTTYALFRPGVPNPLVHLDGCDGSAPASTAAPPPLSADKSGATTGTTDLAIIVGVVVAVVVILIIFCVVAAFVILYVRRRRQTNSVESGSVESDTESEGPEERSSRNNRGRGRSSRRTRSNTNEDNRTISSRPSERSSDRKRSSKSKASSGRSAPPADLWPRSPLGHREIVEDAVQPRGPSDYKYDDVIPTHATSSTDRSFLSDGMPMNGSLSVQRSSAPVLAHGGTTSTNSSNSPFTSSHPLVQLCTSDLPRTPSGIMMQRRNSSSFAHSSSLTESQRHLSRCEYIDSNEWSKGKMLGRGASGTVYNVILGDGSSIAMKEIVLSGDCDEISEQQAAITREVNLITRLTHPNLVTYYRSDVDKKSGTVRIFMELVAGGSLGSLVRGAPEPLPEPVVARFSIQILSALSTIHREGIVHRDLKGDNVLVDSATGVVKITDFGTARALGKGSMKSKAAQTLVGTPYFMAPEMLGGDDLLALSSMSNTSTNSDREKAKDNVAQFGYGVKADIWSFGIMVLELLSRGQVPWPAFVNPGAAFLHIANSSNKPIIPTRLSAECKNFVERCFERNPKLRPTADELLQHPWLPQLRTPPEPPVSSIATVQSDDKM